MGGDFAGLQAFLPYLDDLGVTVLWISNPQENAPDAWSGDCDATYSGYHAYWPGKARAVQPQFGTSAELTELVSAAHARGMRVIMDWVGNHLHENHPWVNSHPDWFNEQALCGDSTHDGSNWDNIPESCWFTSYLPDIDYSQPNALVEMVDEAMWWATAYQMDGFRVDAVKHMSHAVHRNLNSEIARRIEHTAVGGDHRFLTLGETFDGYDAIAAYVNEDELDGQFDFPMYWTIDDVFASQVTTLDALVLAGQVASTTFGGATMSNFLGNHDVIRFTSKAAEGDVGSCWEGNELATAYATTDSNVYDRLILAWSWLFTQPSPPTIYYGDEIGMPGYTDPDNRQPLWWHTGGDLAGVESVDDLAARVGKDQARVLQAVKALANGRRDNPVFWRGETTEWWAQPMKSPNLLALARVDQESGGEMILVMNRSWDTVELSNGLSFAGLSEEGTWRDLLTQETFNATSDALSFTMSPYQARLLLKD
jgi:glycosidase